MKRSPLFLIITALLFCLYSCGSATTPEIERESIDRDYLSSDLSVEARVQSLLAQMTLAEKIGQMTQVDRSYLNDIRDIKTYHLGSILSGGGSTPAVNEAQSWADMTDGYQEQALSTELAIPLIYGVDAVHGHNNLRGATIFPHNIGLGAAGDEDLVERIAQATAVEMAATGIHWNFAPCVAVPQDERWGRTYEGFSESTPLTSRLGAAAVRGYQGEDLSLPYTVLATAKHYVADGGTVDGVDQGNAFMDEGELRRIHLPPYQAAIDESVGSIMASFSSWNGDKMHGHSYLMNDVLKGEMGFSGLMVSDWKAIDQLPGNYSSQVEAAINAGIDMVMVPDEYELFIETLIKLVNRGKVPMERIDEAVGRILTLKFQLGLFEHPLAQRQYLPQVGSQEHRAIAREAVGKSQVLLQNDGILPLSKDLEGVIIAGPLADNLGAQCGGWTITWQGAQGDITQGTSIKEAIVQTLEDDVPVYDSLAQAEGKPVDVMIFVLGETPYAEMNGDRNNLTITYAQTLLARQAQEQGIPVVTLLISGRPLILGELTEQSNALIASWLPGTEGLGVADVLFGDYNPTGRLSYTWPRNMEQIPINSGDGDYNPLYPLGYGLSY